MTTPTETSTPQPLLDLHSLVAGIRWRRRTWVSVALLGLLSGVLLAVLVPAPPTAVTRLLIVHENDQPSDSGNLMRTDIAVLQTARIAEAALEKIDSQQRPAAFLADYEAVALTSNVLELTVHGSSNRDAVGRAEALADVFIADHIRRAAATAGAEADALTERRTQAEADLEKVDQAIAQASVGSGATAAGLSSLYARRAELAAQIGDLGRRAEEAEIGAPQVAAGTQIIDPPRAIPQSLRSTAVMNGAIGLFLGLAVGLALAAVSSLVKDRPVLRRDIATHLAASVIAQLPKSRRGLLGFRRRKRETTERKRVASTIARVIRDASGPVSVLELGCAKTATALAKNIAEEASVDRPVVLVIDLPSRKGHKPIQQTLSPSSSLSMPRRAQHIGVGSVAPGTAWTDLRPLGSETVLVVRAGFGDTAWLHTAARQLADAQIPVIGVVLVHPDPRDRTDGTLWDALHTAVRGRTTPTHLPGRGRMHPRTADHPTEKFRPVESTASENVEVS